MTTVFVSKELGIAITDSRATFQQSRKFLGLFNLTPLPSYKVVNQKALYVHDRLFLACGSVDTIDKVLQYFINGTKFKVNKKTPSCECLLLGKEYGVHLYVYDGKIHKKTIFLEYNFVHFMGSGSSALLRKYYKTLERNTPDEVIDIFKTVHLDDSFTDDNVNLYRI